MPFPKKFTKKVRRAPKSMRVYRAPRSREHYFTRIATSNQAAANALPITLTTDVSGRPQFTNGVNSGTNIALAFRLDQVDLYINGTLSSQFNLPNYTDFTNLFDEFCIRKVDVMVLPNWSNAGMSQTIPGWLPWFIHAADYDDTSNTIATSLMQYDDAKMTQLLGGIGSPNAIPIRTVRPRCKMVALTAAGGNGIAHPVTGDQWIASSNYTAQHLGFKIALDDSWAGSNPSVTIGAVNFAIRYHIKCRDTL